MQIYAETVRSSSPLLPVLRATYTLSVYVAFPVQDVAQDVQRGSVQRIHEST